MTHRDAQNQLTLCSCQLPHRASHPGHPAPRTQGGMCKVGQTRSGSDPFRRLKVERGVRADGRPGVLFDEFYSGSSRQKGTNHLVWLNGTCHLLGFLPWAPNEGQRVSSGVAKRCELGRWRGEISLTRLEDHQKETSQSPALPETPRLPRIKQVDCLHLVVYSLIHSSFYLWNTSIQRQIVPSRWSFRGAVIRKL